jgi:hypothetical protein
VRILLPSDGELWLVVFNVIRQPFGAGRTTIMLSQFGENFPQLKSEKVFVNLVTLFELGIDGIAAIVVLFDSVANVLEKSVQRRE